MHTQMTRRQRVVLLAVVAVTALLATGAYSVVTADRNVSVNVANDENAYVGFDDLRPTATVDEPEEKPILRLTNNFEARSKLTDLTVSETIGVSLSVPDGQRRVLFDTGDQSTLSIRASIHCMSSGEFVVPVTISLTSENAGVRVPEISRQITVRCEPSPGNRTSTETDNRASTETDNRASTETDNRASTETDNRGDEKENRENNESRAGRPE